MKISVIIPIYNSAKYIEKCIESVINQNFMPHEVILVDDGSTDDSGKICDKYSMNYKFVKTIHLENGGVSNARNIGIDNATGDYLTFIDSDDYIEPNMFEQMQKYEGVDLICGGIYEEYFDKSTLRSYHYEMDSREIILQNREVVSRLFKRDSIGNVRFSKYKIGEDVRFLVDLICKNSQISVRFLEDGFYHYVQHSNSAMFNIENYNLFFDSIQNEIEMYQILSNLNIKAANLRLIENGVYNYYKRYLANDIKAKLENRKQYVKVRKISFEYRKIIFSNSKGIKRFLFHFFIVYFPVVIGVYVRFNRKREKL
ncbi:MAG: glycosyltransferase family 2 protein [Wujia sp.]